MKVNNSLASTSARKRDFNPVFIAEEYTTNRLKLYNKSVDIFLINAKFHKDMKIGRDDTILLNRRII